MTDTFDRVITSRPINKQSAIVLSGGYSFDYKRDCRHSETPLPVRKIDFSIRRNPGFSDLTGMKYGWLTVVGLSADQKKSSNTGAAWVVRCVCGHYEIRRTKSLKSGAANPKCCECDQLEYLKTGCNERDECSLLDINS